MYIIIVGAGELGYYLAQILLEEDHDVVVVDPDEKKCEKISTELDIVCHHGNSTESKVLEEAGVKECHALVALTATDETNMVVSLLAKELGAKTVAARLSKIEYDERVLKKLGIDIVIHPEAAAAGYISELITKPEVLDLAFISRGNAEIMEIELKSDSKLSGKRVKDLEQPEGSAIVALFEGEKLVIPKSDTLLRTGNKILVLAERGVADKVRKMLT